MLNRIALGSSYLSIDETYKQFPKWIELSKDETSEYIIDKTGCDWIVTWNIEEPLNSKQNSLQSFFKSWQRGLGFEFDLM